MDRREAVKYISVLLGGTIIGANAFVTGCRTKSGTTQEWTEDDISYLNEIGETILPQTSTPGAKAANVGAFMTVMVSDCYEEGDQKVFREGMKQLDENANAKYGSSFLKLSIQQRHDLLVVLDKEARDYQKKVSDFNQNENEKEREEISRGNLKYNKSHMAPHYFTMMKQLTMLGFFTSKVGMNEALHYVPVPGRFEGCVPYKKGGPLWI